MKAFILALTVLLAGCLDYRIDYYEKGYKHGYDDALLSGHRYSPPNYGGDNIIAYRRGYFQGCSDGSHELLGRTS